MAGIARLTMITNQFKDHRYTLPDVAYAKACKDLQSGEWEIETSGIEMIVAIARKNPEVGYDYIFDSIARNESYVIFDTQYMIKLYGLIFMIRAKLNHSFQKWLVI